MDATLQQCHTIDYMLYFVELGELRYVCMLMHHTIDACSEFQCASALDSEKDNSKMEHLLEVLS